MKIHFDISKWRYIDMVAASPSRQVLSLALAGVIGIASAALLPSSRLALPAALAGLLAIFFCIREWSRPPRRILALAAACFLLGVARFSYVLPRAQAGNLLALDGHVVTLRGSVITLPDTRQDSVRLWIKTDTRREERASVAAGGVVQLFLPLSSAARYGDRLEFTCRVNRLAHPSAAVSFFAREVGTATCASPKNVRILAHTGGSDFLSAIFSARTSFRTAIDRILPEPQASFLAGLILGEQGAIPKDVVETARATGTSHMLAASGYNTGVIARWLFGLLPFLLIRRRRALFVVAGFLVGFVVVSGASASVLRAAVMAAVGLLAALLGRPARVLPSFTLAAFLMLAANPLAIWDIGFQLSVAATLGLIVLAPLLGLSSWLKNLPKALRGPLSDTLAATAATLPVVIWHFGRVSVISPLANVLIAPFVPLGMGVGFVSASVGLLTAPLGTLAGFAAWLVLSGMLKLMQLLAAIPGASLELPAPHFFALLFAVAITLTTLRSMRRISRAQPERVMGEFSAEGFVISDESDGD